MPFGAEPAGAPSTALSESVQLIHQRLLRALICWYWMSDAQPARPRHAAPITWPSVHAGHAKRPGPARHRARRQDSNREGAINGKRQEGIGRARDKAWQGTWGLHRASAQAWRLGPNSTSLPARSWPDPRHACRRLPCDTVRPGTVLSKAPPTPQAPCRDGRMAPPCRSREDVRETPVRPCERAAQLPIGWCEHGPSLPEKEPLHEHPPPCWPAPSAWACGPRPPTPSTWTAKARSS